MYYPYPLDDMRYLHEYTCILTRLKEYSICSQKRANYTE